MQGEIEKALARIGGSSLVEGWREEHAKTPIKRLPTAEVDAFSIGYAIVIGSIATAADLILDQSFREEMADLHQELNPAKQAEIEDVVRKRLDELGLRPNGKGGPHMAMDWYEKLNEELGLKSPYRLRPKNHRILNHTDRRTVIEMLMKGEAGFGDLRFKLYPEMSESAARELFDLHLAADRSSPASLPLRFMSWLWEQSVKAGSPDTAGAPGALFQMLQKMTPNMDWSKWLNQFFDTKCISQGASIGEAMLKLYDAGVLNERVFWTSDFGAAVGGFRRRAIIAATMELGVEFFAFLEGVRLGHIQWSADVKMLARQCSAWRDQPKYLDMKMTAQAVASSGGITRAAMKGDVLNINFVSLGLMVKHLWVHPATTRRHTDRLVQFSREDSQAAIQEFTNRTGISIRPQLSVVSGGQEMRDNLDERLIKVGCMSTRVRVLVSRHERALAQVVARYEVLSRKAEGNDQREALFDTICESWYLSDEQDDQVAMKQLEHDLARIEREIG